ncbi:beta-lactamase family protein [Sphingobium sufflavum]|uniref:serine hydrolase domain-containing protein n=1 Tax=Sphingobium sufflavum TaxID=1129547 RepID=UPI001F3B64B7|nr:serine hydrolase [Sphingobium sufflavum]MCE7795586.1 beta-lactamase family protein [Sphingobium sufflavum]
MHLPPFARLGLAALIALTCGCSPSSREGEVAAVYTGDSDVSTDALRPAVESLFDDEGQDAAGETRAVIVLHDGKVVAERYAPGFTADSRFLSWSVAKTVTAVLVGIMVSDGRLSLDEPVPVPAWQRGADPRGAITLRQMLTMTSGLTHNEKEEPLERTDTLRMLVGDGASDMARYAESKPLAHTPGETWQYSSATTLILSDMMTRLLTNEDSPKARRDAMQRFVRERLMVPVGLNSLIPEYDARGTMIGGAIMHMTARDYGRLGELLRRGGLARGRQIVSQRWVQFMTRPTPVHEGYGGHLWLNRPGSERVMFVDDAPRSLYAANGLRGQYVIVSPAQGLTIVRLGVTSDEQLPALRERLARIIRKFPGG